MGLEQELDSEDRFSKMKPKTHDLTQEMRKFEKFNGDKIVNGLSDDTQSLNHGLFKQNSPDGLFKQNSPEGEKERQIHEDSPKSTDCWQDPNGQSTPENTDSEEERYQDLESPNDSRGFKDESSTSPFILNDGQHRILTKQGPLQSSNRPFVCAGCAYPIFDDFILLMNGENWHERCLYCCSCRKYLNQEVKCYIRDGAIYCREDYISSFGAKCAKCHLRLTPKDWVRKAKGILFHLACFSCYICSYHLSTGDEFGIQGKKILCRNHYFNHPDVKTPDSEASSYTENNKRGEKRKRMRTTFSEEQLGILQKNFEAEANPSGENLSSIAGQVGLSKRVTQVWFQNARARMRQKRPPVCQ